MIFAWLLVCEKNLRFNKLHSTASACHMPKLDGIH